MKSSVNLCLTILLLALTASEASHRHCSRRKKDDVHIEVFYPRGLAVWYPKQQDVKGFGIEIFLNQKHMKNETKCDICLNTTDITYGKFMIRHDDAIIRSGDHLKYRVIKHMANGSVSVLKSNEFIVADYRMLPRLEPCRPRVPTSVSSKYQSVITQLEAEISLMENIVHEVIQRCGNVNLTSRNLYLQSSQHKPLLESKALYNHTLQVLKKMLPTIGWEKALTHAFYYETGIGFEVRTLADKLKILHLAKNSVHSLAIIDMDKMGNFESEIGSGDGFKIRDSDVAKV